MSVEAISLPVYHVNFSDERSLIQKIKAFILSIFKEIQHFFEVACYALHIWRHGKPEEYVSHDKETFEWKQENQGLFVLIHGLRGHPNIWRRQLSKLRAKPEYEIKIPFVHSEGNCPISEAVRPILNMVKDYAVAFPSNPICLMGVSNGARIAQDIEFKLREAHENPVKVSSIAGALLGTKKINRFKGPITTLLYHRDIVTDLTYLSEDTCTRISQSRQELAPHLTRSFDFYASTEDSVIEPFHASLPILNQEEIHFVVNGVNHNGIVSFVAPEQVDRCTAWMSTFNKSLV